MFIIYVYLHNVHLPEFLWKQCTLLAVLQLDRFEFLQRVNLHESSRLPPNWDARNGVIVNAARNYSKTTTIISYYKGTYTGTFVTLFSPKKLVKYTSFPPYFTGEFSAKATLSTSAPATAITRRERISYIEAWIAGDFWGKKLHRDFVLKKKMEVDKFQKSIANSPGGWI